MRHATRPSRRAFAEAVCGAVAVVAVLTSIWARGRAFAAGYVTREPPAHRDYRPQAPAKRPYNRNLADGRTNKDWTREITRTKNVDALLELVDSAVLESSFNIINAAAALNRYAVLRAGKRERIGQGAFNDLLFRTRDLLLEEQGRMRELCSLIRACVKLRRTPEFQQVKERLVPVIADRATTLADTATARDIFTIYWASAQLRVEAPRLFRILPRLARRIPVIQESMTPQDVAHAFWSVATLLREQPKLWMSLISIIDVVPEKAADMNAQNFANMFWAIAKMRHRAPVLGRVLPTLIKHAPAVTVDMTAHDISLIVWALGLADLQTPEVELLLDSLRISTFKKLETFKIQDLADTLLGFSLCGVCDAPTLQAASNTVAAQAPRLREQDVLRNVPKLVFAMAKVKFEDPAMMRAVSERLEYPILRKLSSWALCSSLYVMKEYYPGTDFQRIRGNLINEVDRRQLGVEHIVASWLGPEEWLEAVEEPSVWADRPKWAEK